MTMVVIIASYSLQALENIKPGSFVVEYVGEVITSEQAEERGKKYDAEGEIVKNN